MTTTPATALARQQVAELLESRTVRPGAGGGLVETCGRCGGRGVMVEYSSTYNGVCFECHGTGWTATTEDRLVNRYAARIRRERKAEREAPARAAAEQAAALAAAAEVETWKAANRELVADLAAAADDGVGFAVEMMDRLADGRTLTDGQRAAAARLVEDRRAAVPVVEGRGVITGHVVSAREQVSSYGHRSTYTTRITVKDDRGFTVWGTLSSAMDDGRSLDEWRGQRVTFTATVEASDRDATFGFFKRPTRGELLPAD